ncbi:MAG: hypothetical protein ABI165_12035 [Bryobacteraceae bacterium]
MQSLSGYARTPLIACGAWQGASQPIVNRREIDTQPGENRSVTV